MFDLSYQTQSLNYIFPIFIQSINICVVQSAKKNQATAAIYRVRVQQLSIVFVCVNNRVVQIKNMDETNQIMRRQ